MEKGLQENLKTRSILFNKVIRYLKHHEIELEKWDACIRHSINGLIYAYSWYLNERAGEWDALVEDDYESVFPLVHNSKWGIKYLYQPYFAQQLGLFSVKPVNTELIWDFLEAIPKKFRLVEINLNTENRIFHPSFEVRERKTHHLDLSASYSEIAEGYNEDNRKNLKKARKAGLQIAGPVNPEEIIRLYVEAYGAMNPGISEEDYRSMNRLIHMALQKNMAETVGVYDRFNTLCGAAVFFISNGKAIYAFGAPSAEGRDLRSTHFLLDEFIKNKAGQPLTLDFEGSEIPSVAYFYRKFGGKPVNYYFIRRNRLPWFVKLFKP